jgi:predicted amidohydrolase YtcJ
VPADLVLVNGNILTVNRSDEVVEAIAVTNGRISAVGTSQEIRTLVGARTRVIDLHGRTATPGLIDSHVHFSEAGEMFTIDLSDAAITRIDDVKARIAERLKTSSPASGCADRVGTRASWRSAVFSPPPIWMRLRRVTRCGFSSS